MIITFKEPITTASGVVFPKGFKLSCDAIMNLSNGRTQFSNLTLVHPAFPLVAEPAFQLSDSDLGKLEITLELPAPKPV